MSRTPVVKKLKNDTSEQRREEQLLIRHAGVLGLCACILAYPYDVPDFMPELLMKLSEHVNDPQPIQVITNVSVFSCSITLVYHALHAVLLKNIRHFLQHYISKSDISCSITQVYQAFHVALHNLMCIKLLAVFLQILTSFKCCIIS